MRITLLLAAGLLAYSNSLSGPFVLDDIPTVVTNASIRQLTSPAVLSPPRGLPVAGRPLVNLSLAVNYALGGLEVRGYHLFNVGVHLACALLIFGIVRRTLAADEVAFAVALIWLLHPLNTEVVDYVTQRTESMMAFFYLLTLYAAIRGWLIVGVAACAMGMACKESMVTAPVAVMLYDRVFRFSSWKDALRSRWPLYAALAATWTELAALNWSNPRGLSAGLATDVDAFTYLLNQSTAIVRYLWLSVWPRALVVSYGLPQPLTVRDVLPHLSVVAVLVVATVVALTAGARGPSRASALGFLGAWFFLTLAPTSSFVPIATEVAAERRMYLPLVAVIVLAVLGVNAMLQRLHARRLVRAAALCVVALLLIAATRSRNDEYRSPLTLGYTVLERGPKGTGHFMVGTELLAAGRHDEAAAHLQDALGSDPRARYALGMALFRQEKMSRAIDELRTFTREHPDLLEVVPARMMIGRALTSEGRLSDAVAEFEAVLAMVPSYTDAHGGLADALFAQDRYEDASAHYREFLRQQPDDFAALTKLGIAQATLGRFDEAVAAFERAAAVRPQDEGARRNLAAAIEDRAKARQ